MFKPPILLWQPWQMNVGRDAKDDEKEKPFVFAIYYKQIKIYVFLDPKFQSGEISNTHNKNNELYNR